MRVLHLFKTYLPDNFAGVERVIWNIAESTHALGVESDVLALSRQPNPHPLRQDHHLVHQARQNLYIASTGLSLSVFSKFSKLMRQVDLVHYHFPWPMMDLLHLATRTSRPSVVTYHSDVVKQVSMLRLYKPLMYRFLDSVDHIVATSPDYLSTSPVLKRFHHKASVIPIGIDEKRTSVSNETRARWQRRLGEGFFLFIGVARYYKGLDFLLDAAEKTGLPVVIAGPEPNNLPAAAKISNVSVIGRFNDEDKEALLDLAAALVLPSHQRSEAFGVVLAEAARAGRPMITCDIGTGTSFVNLNGTTGIVVTPADSTALAGAMQRLYRNDSLLREMGKRSSERFNKHFTSATMGQRYARLYASLVRKTV